MSKDRRENKDQEPAKPSNRKTQPRISQSQKEEKSKEVAKSADDVFAKRLTAIAGLLGAITAFIVGVVFTWPKPNIFFPATPTTHGSTETLIPYAQIQSLEVIQDGNIITKNPGETIDLTMGANVIIKANLIANTSLDDLVFHWDFCHKEKNKAGQGVIEISYLASEMGMDCINVKIEKGGQYLDTANFWVSIGKSQP